ncbi:MAG: isopentenyl phosphate kinase [Candidatus Bilamarchaeaceae archaeon]
MQVLKLGGSVLTDKSSYMKADERNIISLSAMLGRVWNSGTRNFLLIHGAGSFGHPLVVKYGLENGVKTPDQKLGAAITHSACSRLSEMVVSALNSYGVPAVSLPPSLLGKMESRRLVEFNRKPVDSLLQLGYLPVLYGDMLPDSKLGCAPCSGDQLVSWFGKRAEKVIVGTNVDGVLADGKLVPEISKSNFLSISRHFNDRNAKHADVTGGMGGKVRELLGIGKPCYIANALCPERFEALLEGKEAPSTLIK